MPPKSNHPPLPPCPTPHIPNQVNTYSWNRYRCRNPVHQCYWCRTYSTNLRHMPPADLLITEGSYPVRFIRNMPIGPTPQDEYELALKWVLERRLFNISGQRVKVHMYTFPNARQAAIMNERMPDLPLTIQARVMIDFPRVVVLSPPFMDRVFGALDGHDWDWHVIAPHPRQCWSQFRMDWFATKANLEGNFL